MMKVHHALQSYFGSPPSKPDTGSNDDSTPFTLPDDDAEQKAPAASVTSSGVPSSISSGFWLNQAGGTSPATDDGVAAAGDDAAGDTCSDDLLAEFARLASMTPAEKIRAQYLQNHNLTEDQFAQLSGDAQKAINDQIAAQIKQKLGVGGLNGGDDSGASDTDAAIAVA
jgi:hypothetical protein